MAPPAVPDADLAQFIRDHRDEIYRLWTGMAVGAPGVRTAFDITLERMADLLEQGPVDRPSARRSGRQLRDRAAEGAPLPQLVIELLAFRRSAAALLGPAAGAHRLHDACDGVLLELVAAYDRTHVQTSEAVDQAIASRRSGTLVELLGCLVDLVVDLSDALRAAVFLVVDDGVLRVRAAAGDHAFHPVGRTQSFGAGLEGMAATTRRPHLGTVGDPLFAQSVCAGPNATRAYAVPVENGPDLVAVAVLTSDDPGPFRVEELEMFRLVTRRAAALIGEIDARERLQTEHARLRSFFDQAPALLCLKGRDGRYLAVNRQAAQILGRAEADLIGRCDVDLFPPALAEVLASDDRRVIDLAQTLVVEPRLANGDGWHTLLAAKFPVRDARGEVETLGFVAMDITGRAHREERDRLLAQVSTIVGSSLVREETLANIARSATATFADICIVDVAHDGGCRVIIRVAETEGRRGEIARALERLPPEPTRPRLLSAVLTAQRPILIPTLSVTAIEIMTRNPQHSQLLERLGPQSFLGVPLRSSGGRYLGAIGFLSTRAHRRYETGDIEVAEAIAQRAALALENARRFELAKRLEREQRFLADASRHLGESLDVEATMSRIVQLAVPFFADWAVVYVCQDHRIVRKQHAIQIGSDRTALLDELVARYAPGLDRGEGPFGPVRTGQSTVLAGLDATEVAAQAQDEEHARMLLALGCRSALVVPLVVQDRVLGELGLMITTGHRGSYDPKHVALAEDLGRRLATALDKAGLYLRAQRATRARDEVLGVVAHDLRNPLSIIGVSTSLLLRRLDPVVDQEHFRSVEMIKRASERMNHLIGDLLDIRSMEAGQLSVERARHDVKLLVNEAAEQHRPLALPAGLTLLTEVGAEMPPVVGDHDRLNQVLSNLLGNAFKFTPAGGEVVLGARVEGAFVRFSVRDTGPGIAAEALQHIFDRFWRASRTDRRGAGLGLAICRGIVEAHGGTLQVRSEPGRGSDFSFTIPALVGPAPPLVSPCRRCQGPPAQTEA